MWDAGEVAGQLVPPGSVFAFLAEHRTELFPDSFTADLFPSRTGRPSLPADLVGSVLVLKELYDLSDTQTADALKFDIRWKVACGRSLLQTSFDPSVLVYWRRRIAASQRPDRVFDAVAQLIAETGILRGRRKRCVDSTVFDDAVATMDTVSQLVAAMRKVARVVDGAGEAIAAVCKLDYSRPGKPDIDWDDPAAKEALVSDLVNDALAVLDVLAGPDAPERDAAQADALGLLALVAGQDVEPAEGSDGTDGRWRIARKVAPDRVISTVDRQARHTRKCKSKRRDGFRGHVAAEPETGLITDCEMTMAAGEGSADAENGVKMACRDRFGSDSSGDAAPARPASAPGQAADTADQRHGQAQDAPPQGTHDQAQPPSARDGEGLEIYGDSAYGSGEARAAYLDAGHDTIIKPGPVRPAVPGGFTLDDFTVDEEQGTVTCPAGQVRQMSKTRTVTFGAACAAAAGTVHHRQRRQVDDHPPARRAAARRPRPGPHRGIQAGLPHPVSHRAHHLLDRDPERPPGPAPLLRHRQERRLAAQPVRRDQPAHPATARADPPARGLGAGLTGQHPAPGPAAMACATSGRVSGPPPGAIPAAGGPSRVPEPDQPTTRPSTGSGIFRVVLADQENFSRQVAA